MKCNFMFENKLNKIAIFGRTPNKNQRSAVITILAGKTTKLQLKKNNENSFYLNRLVTIWFIVLLFFRYADKN